MKKLVITTLATVGLALGAFAQGSIILDNSTASYGIANTTPGNYYTGTYGLELWVDNAAAVPAGINGAANTAAYAALTTTGFKLEATYAGQTMNISNPGVFQLGTVTMNDVTALVSSAVIGLAAWTGSAASGTAAMVANANIGVVAFLDSTIADPSPLAGPPGTPSNLGTAWTTGDLVMMPVPEPTTMALAGLGAAALLIFRRRK